MRNIFIFGWCSILTKFSTIRKLPAIYTAYTFHFDCIVSLVLCSLVLELSHSLFFSIPLYCNSPIPAVFKKDDRGHRRDESSSKEPVEAPPTYIPVVGESGPELKAVGQELGKRKTDTLATDDFHYDKYRKKVRRWYCRLFYCKLIYFLLLIIKVCKMSSLINNY